MVTYGELFAFCSVIIGTITMVVAVITVVVAITNMKK